MKPGRRRIVVAAEVSAVAAAVVVAAGVGAAAVAVVVADVIKSHPAHRIGAPAPVVVTAQSV